MINNEQAQTALRTLLQLTEDGGRPMSVIEARCGNPGCTRIHGMAIVVTDPRMAAGLSAMIQQMFPADGPATELK